MTRKLAKLRPAGVNKDLAPFDVDPGQWTDVRNVLARNGYQQRVNGDTDVFGTPIGSVVYLQPVLTETVAYWMYATGAGGTELIGVTDGVLHTDISPVVAVDTGGRQSPWTGGIFNGVPIINPGGDGPPLFWDLTPATPCAPLPGWEANAFARSIRPFKNFLMAMDYTDGAGDRIETLVKWSDAAPPGTLPTEWQPTPANFAGFLSLADTDGPCIDGLALRNSFMVYKSGSTYSLDFIGGQFVFAQRLLYGQSGILARGCVAEFQGRHCIMTDGDVVVSDGQNLQSIVDKRMRRYLFNTIDGDNYRTSFVVLNKSRSEIWICYPTTGNAYPNQALVWSYEDNGFGIRDLYGTPHAASGIFPSSAAVATDWNSQAQTWGASVPPWDQANFVSAEDALLLADPDDGFYRNETGYDFHGLPITARLVREGLDFGAPDEIKLVRAIWPRLQANGGELFTVQVGAQMSPGDPIAWSPGVPFVYGTDEKVDVFANGRFISVAIDSVGGSIWRASGFDVEFAGGSRH